MGAATWRTFQRADHDPRDSGVTWSNALWPTAIAAEIANMTQRGMERKRRAARKIIEHPSAQMTWIIAYWKVMSAASPTNQAARTTVNSRKMSQHPRRKRERARRCRGFPLVAESAAPTPARKTKTG